MHFKGKRNDFQYLNCLFLYLRTWSYSVQNKPDIPNNLSGPLWESVQVAQVPCSTGRFHAYKGGPFSDSGFAKWDALQCRLGRDLKPRGRDSQLRRESRDQTDCLVLHRGPNSWRRKAAELPTATGPGERGCVSNRHGDGASFPPTCSRPHMRSNSLSHHSQPGT